MSAVGKRVVFALLIGCAMILMNGCRTSFVQHYEDDQLPRKRVALFRPCPSEEEMKLLGIPGLETMGFVEEVGDRHIFNGAYAVEVLPGTYPVRFMYQAGGTWYTATGTLIASPNSIYCWSWPEKRLVKSGVPYDHLIFPPRDKYQSNKPATSLVLDLETGLMNGVSPKDSVEEIKKRLPFYTDVDGDCVDFSYHEFIVEHNTFYVGSNFRGRVSPPIMKASHAQVTKVLGEPDERIGEQEYYYKRDYGSIGVFFKNDVVYRIDVSFD